MKATNTLLTHLAYSYDTSISIYIYIDIDRDIALMSGKPLAVGSVQQQCSARYKKLSLGVSVQTSVPFQVIPSKEEKKTKKTNKVCGRFKLKIASAPPCVRVESHPGVLEDETGRKYSLGRECFEVKKKKTSYIQTPYIIDISIYRYSYRYIYTSIDIYTWRVCIAPP